MKLFELENKCALITGGGRGIGAATAELFASAGAAVAIVDVNLDAARKVVDEIKSHEGQRAIAIRCDITDEAAVETAVERCIEELGGLDILVNNAGMAIRKPATELRMDEWQKVIDLNLGALFSCSRVAARHMRKRRPDAPPGGAIINLASIMGLSGGIFPNAAYQASKGGVVNLTRALALEWAQDRIRVNAVAPTYVNTDLTVNIFNNPDVMEKVEAHTPLGVLPEVGDVAAAILFLASPAARCITGVTLPVDSGYLAR
ncbi:MAG TPA: SDR family NAD(P)-dependent oxidoreductase [Burkholderiales bacterium]|nr:SDR family NAD(P)-dependent oxidoreductase [Burkholderiales bacterium]